MKEQNHQDGAGSDGGLHQCFDSVHEAWWCSARQFFFFATFVFLAAFWCGRAAYWNTHTEDLFSDMADFEFTARGVLSSFTFDFNSFFKSYLSPSIPLLRATQILIFGDSMLGWRIFQGIILCVGVIWVAYELFVTTRSRALVIGLLAVFAVSKPSIFWSFKLAREGIGESMMMLCLASTMHALRTQSGYRSFLAGVIFFVAMMVRGTFIFSLPFVLFLFLVPFSVRETAKDHQGWQSRQRGKSMRSCRDGGWRFRCTLLFALGVGVAWTPWLIRTYRLYGAPVFLSTMGPYVFFWDLGTSKVTLEDGSVVEVTAQGLQDQAAARFKNDYESSVYAQHLMKLYLKQNLEHIPGLFWSRLRNTVIDPDVHLTRISRQDLYPGTSLDERLLIDKKAWALALGIGGLLVLPVVFGRIELFLLPVLSVIPWVNAAIMIGYARMLESFISLFLFGVVALLIGSLVLLADWFGIKLRPAIVSVA